MRAALRDDRGSIIPLVLGFFLIALIMVAGSVAAGDVFVQQRGLQSVCDGAAAAAASSADVDGGRHVAGQRQLRYLQLDQVQRAVDAYLTRDPSRDAVQIAATVSPDGTVVVADCTVDDPVAFGSLFGFGSGLHHHAQSSARAPVQVG